MSYILLCFIFLGGISNLKGNTVQERTKTIYERWRIIQYNQDRHISQVLLLLYDKHIYTYV